MRFFRLTLLMAMLGLLQACATMGKDECLNADWRTIGYEDGTRGLPASQIGEHRTDCAKYGVTPDLKAYLAGRDQGLMEYCKADNGFRIGAAGTSYSPVCPPVLEAAFRSAYHRGHQLYALQSALHSVEAEIDSRHDELNKIKKRIEKKSAELIDENTTTKDRVTLLVDIKDLNDRKHHVKEEIEMLLQEREARAADLADYQSSLTLD